MHGGIIMTDTKTLTDPHTQQQWIAESPVEELNVIAEEQDPTEEEQTAIDQAIAAAIAADEDSQ